MRSSYMEVKIFTLAAKASRNVANSRKFRMDKKLLLRGPRIRKRVLYVKEILSVAAIQTVN